MVAEILLMTSNPKNPFQLDFDYIDGLPVEESILLTGSLLAFLENMWIQANPSINFVNDCKIYSFLLLLHMLKLQRINSICRNSSVTIQTY